ncbi:hypothetical protein BGW36DRAFT_450569 [Talaromyces proteolyticus]|uniref:IBR domain-containing protein n=1 Tax=Talaromyces proteolyticus TaxID=1131652 RepID=A0AAD4KWY5_9EURO|nr:uncharacterized protein BGW36DRAFT_450569 [Talaromyces proteolyticus]KAH8697824.1 hypothetical protein BGW36DRAFT_450569 [Talaromyces proteolyticus]
MIAMTCVIFPLDLCHDYSTPGSSHCTCFIPWKSSRLSLSDTEKPTELTDMLDPINTLSNQSAENQLDNIIDSYDQRPDRTIPDPDSPSGEEPTLLVEDILKQDEARSFYFDFEESDQDDAKSASSQYSRSIHDRLRSSSKVTEQAQLNGLPAVPPLPSNFAPPNFSIRPLALQHLNYRVSDVTSFSSSFTFKQCKACKHIKEANEVVRFHCSDEYCHNCASNLLLKSTLRTVFTPPHCCGQEISLPLFQPCIDKETELYLRGKYMEYHGKNRTESACAVKGNEELEPSQVIRRNQNITEQERWQQCHICHRLIECKYCRSYSCSRTL